MKRFIVLALLVIVMTMVFALPASAGLVGPCTSDGAGYGQNHIVHQATNGGIGAGGPIPGEHQGFSYCDPPG